MYFLSRMVAVRSAVLAGVSLVVLMMGGCSTSSSSSTVTAAPAFSPGAGTYTSSQTVTITDATSGAVLYCTTDGTTPTSSSPVCSQPTTVFKSQFLQAIAIAPGMAASPVTSAGYTINLSAAATPTFSPAGGTYTSTQTVTINDATAGANIFYTLDGTAPTASSTLYTGAITISKNATISAIATASGLSNSGVASAAYTIGNTVATPTFSPAAGAYTSAQTVTIADVTSGATIFYTTDGSVPTTSSTKYTNPITVSGTQTINAIATAIGFTNSTVATAAYTITQSSTPAATAVFAPAGGTYTATQTVTIMDTTAGAVIHYTVDGSAPTASSPSYSGPITVSATQTINALATAAGFTNSAVASATYTISGGTPAATPTFSPAAGAYTSAQTVTIADTTAGAVIHYTVDGSAPTASSPTYSSPIAVSGTQTINALATATGFTNSAVATAAYTITIPGGSKLSGSVFSGTVAVAGAQVQLYAAGQSDYGAAGTLLGPAGTTDGSGAFSVTYNCPAAPGNQLYLVATGGNAGAGANTKLQLMAALGTCANVTSSTAIRINEVTTVASAYALAQFATPNPSGPGVRIGTSSGNAAGLVNAMKTVNNLMDLGSGTALTITPSYKTKGGTSGALLNSSYVPQARINTLANLLNSCASSNGSGAGCTNLFSAAAPASGAIPADTLQAIVDIAQHPGSNAATLYGLASSSAAFKPSLSSAPTDWTLALTFTGGGLGVAAGINPPLGGSLKNMAIDSAGTIWASANSICGDTKTFSGSKSAVVAFDNQGNSLSPDTTVSGTVFCGGYQPQFNGAAVLNIPAALAVDLNGFIWVGNLTSTGSTKLSSDGTVKQANYPIPKTGQACSNLTAFAVDGSNTLWAGCNQGFGVISATDGTAIGGVSNYGPAQSPIIDIFAISLDSLGNAWGVVAANQATTINLYQVNNNGGQIVVTSDHSTSGSTFKADVLADGVGDVFSVSNTPGNLSVLGPDQKTVQSLPYPVPAGAYGIQRLALDGASNLWGAAYSGIVPNGDALIPSYLVQMSSTGTILSPSGTNVYGYTGTGGGGETQPILANRLSGTNAYAGIAVDGSGNVWVGLGAQPIITDTKVLPGENLVEFIGIAPPVVTPTALALKNNQVGARP